jgi:methanol:N,N-dimethyl-4-nitrosoaniline oxidoreductase
VINKEMRKFPMLYTGPIGRTVVGWGAHTIVADECKMANVKKALITSTGLKGTGIVDEIKGILEYNGIATEVYDKVTSNPKDFQVMEAYKIFKEAECDGIVSVGGGSSHDCGKGVRLVACNDGKDIRNLIAEMPWMTGMLKFKPVTIPQISVTTTAGTGAEISRLGVIVNTQTRSKETAIALGITPTVGLIDPLLVRLMPQNIVAWTGWDAFAHAFEGYLGALLPEGQATALKAVQLVAENLREFAYNRMNYVACENMCHAASMMRIILGLGAGLGGVLGSHLIADPIEAITDSHHGRTIALVTLPTQRYNEAGYAERFGELARAMGVDTKGMTKMQAADKWFDEVERLLADLNFKTGHLSEQVGLKKEDLKVIATQATTSFLGQSIQVGDDEIIKLLERLL